MINPAVLRELSWSASKLREVAAALGALSVRLTKAPEGAKLTGLEPIESRTKSTRPGVGEGEGPPHPAQVSFEWW